jgi:hypothetical protein
MKQPHLARPSMRRLSHFLLAATAAVAMIGITATPASAVPGPYQTTGHIVAGSRLGVAGGSCSAGLVLKQSGTVAGQYAQAMRYVVTAAHCFGRGSDDVSYDGEVVGRAIWKDPATDLALVAIDPTTSGQRNCAPTSGMWHCFGHVTHKPRALGRVILSRIGVRGEQKIPVIGTGAPPTGTVFCSSGAWSGSDCTLSSARATPEMNLRPGERLAVARSAFPPVPGDSGGLICSYNGTAYGIMTQVVSNASNTFTAYMPISVFFERVPGHYELAPADE